MNKDRCQKYLWSFVFILFYSLSLMVIMGLPFSVHNQYEFEYANNSGELRGAEIGDKVQVRNGNLSNWDEGTITSILPLEVDNLNWDQIRTKTHFCFMSVNAASIYYQLEINPNQIVETDKEWYLEGCCNPDNEEITCSIEELTLFWILILCIMIPFALCGFFNIVMRAGLCCAGKYSYVDEYIYGMSEDDQAFARGLCLKYWKYIFTVLYISFIVSITFERSRLYNYPDPLEATYDWPDDTIWESSYKFGTYMYWLMFVIMHFVILGTLVVEKYTSYSLMAWLNVKRTWYNPEDPHFIQSCCLFPCFTNILHACCSEDAEETETQSTTLLIEEDVPQKRKHRRRKRKKHKTESHPMIEDLPSYKNAIDTGTTGASGSYPKSQVYENIIPSAPSVELATGKNYCDQCGNQFLRNTKYCSNCGASRFQSSEAVE